MIGCELTEYDDGIKRLLKETRASMSKPQIWVHRANSGDVPALRFLTMGTTMVYHFVCKEWDSMFRW